MVIAKTSANHCMVFERGLSVRTSNTAARSRVCPLHAMPLDRISLTHAVVDFLGNECDRLGPTVVSVEARPLSVEHEQDGVKQP